MIADVLRPFKKRINPKKRFLEIQQGIAEKAEKEKKDSYGEAPAINNVEMSSGLLTLNTSVKDASKDLKKRKFAETEGTQGQIILG